ASRELWVVQTEAGIELAVELELPQARQRSDRVSLPGQQPELRADPRSADRSKRARADCLGHKLAGSGFDLEPQSGVVSREAKHARGIVDEAALVQHTKEPRLEVLQRARGCGQLAGAVPGERDRDRVDGEVSPSQILLQRG